MRIHGVEDPPGQLLGFQQVPKLGQGCRVRRRLAVQVNADKSTNGLAVVDRVLDTFVRQTKALLGCPSHYLI